MVLKNKDIILNSEILYYSTTHNFDDIRFKKLGKITGDDSLKKETWKNYREPLKLFGIKFKNNNTKLPLFIKGPKILNPIKYSENLGSAQCKSAMMIAALKAQGKTRLRCKPSRDHTELMFKNVLKIPMKIQKKKNYDLIELNGVSEFKNFNYKIPGDISSASFLIVLTLLSNKNILKIKNINVNPTRTGIIKILNMMGAKIRILNKKKYKGELIADILIKSNKNLRSINLNPKLNSSAIDEFLLIFLVYEVVIFFLVTFRTEQKESKRLNWGLKFYNDEY